MPGTQEAHIARATYTAPRASRWISNTTASNAGLPALALLRGPYVRALVR